MAYEDPIIKKYADLIKAAQPEFKEIFQGDPMRIADSMLPCLIIEKRETGARVFTNAQDEHAIGLRFIIVTSIRRELSTVEESKKLVAGIASLYDLAEGRDADYKLKASSVLGILRGNRHVDTAKNLRTDLDTITTVDYGETLREREPEAWSVEARVDAIAHFIQLR